ISLDSLGKKDVWIDALGADGARYSNLFITRFDYAPLTINVIEPAYRNSIYFTEDVKIVRAEVSLNVPEAKLAGATLETRLTSLVPQSSAISPGARKLSVSFPADKLGEGEYRLEALLKDKSGKTLESCAVPVFKLGKAPGVEARVDKDGNVLIDGIPMFFRGWYGGFVYLVTEGALAKIRCPRATNFSWGDTPANSIRNGYFYLTTFPVPEFEELAKADGKLPEAAKQQIVDFIKSQQNMRNMVGYYLSDEPECRGLSADTLGELYDFVKKHDPWRLCVIVSRSPATYINACDVICPHPYMNPVMSPDGQRSLSYDGAYIHRIMSEAVESINGRAKSLWNMPQVASYYLISATAFTKCVQPDFDQARWSILSGVANRAKGMIPYIFCDYWNDIGNRIGVSYVFETLAWLEPAIVEGQELALGIDGSVDAVGKIAPDGEAYIVAANRSDLEIQASFSSPGLERFTRIQVVGENRSLEVKDGRFSDRFALHGAHVYTSLEALPYMKTLDEVRGEIAAFGKDRQPDNLLRDGATDWAVGDDGRNCRIYGDQLADGCVDAGGWYPVYGNRTELLLVFPKGVKFHKFVFHSNNIAAAHLQAWNDGKWIELKKWDDLQGFRHTWEGAQTETVKLRLLVDKVKSRQLPSVTEVELY
ncbi:MAG: hypothetical protein PHR35_11320, partial [Kiritimatiellae bacterium]|nr:hypothetical protein [Kiritimatiellia bacterium]